MHAAVVAEWCLHCCNGPPNSADFSGHCWPVWLRCICDGRGYVPPRSNNKEGETAVCKSHLLCILVQQAHKRERERRIVSVYVQDPAVAGITRIRLRGNATRT